MAKRSVSNLFDDEEDDFFSSWKPTKVTTREKGLKVDDVQPVKAKRKPFASPKLDIDFDFEMPSFDLDLEGLDFNTPFNPQAKSKPDKDKSPEGTDDFPFNLKRSDNITVTSKVSKEDKIDSPAPSAKSVNILVHKEIPIIADPEVRDVELPESKLCQKEMGDIQALDAGEQSSSPKERDQVLTSKENSEARMIYPPSKDLPIQICEADVESESVNSDRGETLSPRFKRASGEPSTSSSHRSFPYRPEEQPSSEAHSVSLPSEGELKQSEAVEIPEVNPHPTRPEDIVHTEDRHTSKFKTSKEHGFVGGAKIIKIQEEANKHTHLNVIPVKEQQSLISNAGARQSSQMLAVQEKERTEVEKRLVGNTLEIDNNLLHMSLEQRSENTEVDKLGPSQDIKGLQQDLKINKPDHTVAPPINDEKRHVQEETVTDPMDDTPVVNVPVTKSVYFGKKTPQSLPQVSTVKAATRDQQPKADHTMVKNNVDGNLPRRDINRTPISSNAILTSGSSLMKEQKVVQDLAEVDSAASRGNVLQPLGGIYKSKQSLLIQEKEGQGGSAGTNKRNLTNGNRKHDRKQVRWQTTDPLMPKKDETKIESLLKPSTPASYPTVPLSSRSELTSTTTPIGEQAANKPKRKKLLSWADRLQSSAQVQRVSVQSKSFRKIITEASENTLGLVDLARSKNIETNRMRSETTFQFSQRSNFQSTHQLIAPTNEGLQYSPKTRAEPEGHQSGARTPEKSLEARNVKESQQRFANADASAVLIHSSAEVLMSERRSIIEQANRCSDGLGEMMRTLKKLNGEAKDLIVRALVCNNKLLMMQSPMNEAKISTLTIS